MATDQQESAKIEQLSPRRPRRARSTPPAASARNLEGWIPALATDDEIREALEKAFDYRGDITITLKDGNRVEGYIYDRRPGRTLADSFVRIIPTANRVQAQHPLRRRSPRSPSPAATPPPARPSKPGSRSTGKRKPPAKKTSRSSPKS